VRQALRSSSLVFNIYSKNQSIKETFANNLAYFLIRRKIFERKREVNSFDELVKSEETLYIITSTLR
jgi:hypothetical protein